MGAIRKEPCLAWAVCFPISDHVIFSRELFFCLSKHYSFIYTELFGNLKAIFPKSIITWSEMGQQTVQAKEVYCLECAARESERGPVGKLNNWYIFWLVSFDSFCQQSYFSDADEKSDSVDWLTQFLWLVTFVHLLLSFRSLDLSLLRTCLWRALYAGLLGPGCLIILCVV